MNIDQFKPLTVYTIYIASTPEKVWEALTTAEFSRKYFFGNAVEVAPRLGGAFIVRTPDGALHISGEVLEYDPPRKLSVTFNVNWPELIEKLGPTLVTYEIEPVGEAVRLTMSEGHDRPLSDDILSGDPVQSQERARDRQATRGQDRPAPTHAGRAEGHGCQDALVLPIVVPDKQSAAER